MLAATLVLASAVGCDEDGKTAPEACKDPELPIFDISDPEPGDTGDDNPCVTKVGTAFSPPNGGTTSGGSATGGSTATAGSGGTSSGAGGTDGGAGGTDGGGGDGGA